MGTKGVEKRHSETAIVAALYRAIAGKDDLKRGLGSDYLAEYFLPPHLKFLIRFKKIRQKVKAKDRTLTPGMFEYMLARTTFFDSVFLNALNHHIPQIVLLGAGYDTRAFRFRTPSNHSMIFELDIATTQNRKRTCLKKADMDIPAHVKLVPINFNKDPLKEVLENAGYENNVETLFIWEGVCYYLDPNSVDATLDYLKCFSHPESVLAFDYALSVSEHNMDQYYGAEEFVRTWKKHRAAEAFRFTVEEDQIDPFLTQRGMGWVRPFYNKEIEDKFLPKNKSSSNSRINGLFRFCLASPNSQSPPWIKL